MKTLNRRDKMYVIMAVLSLSAFTSYYFWNLAQSNYHTDAEFGEQRCGMDLERTKYQLALVSDYKNRIDKLLTETKRSYEGDKERFRDIMDSCIAMKQQCNFCQTQFEDLQGECKVVREQLNKALKELEEYKTSKTGG